MKVLAKISSLALVATGATGQSDQSGTTGTPSEPSVVTYESIGLYPLERVMTENLPPEDLATLSLLNKDEQKPRSFIPGVSYMLNNLQEYGCWCFFDEKHGRGRGSPVDAFDTHCMKYHHAVSCAKREIASCDPYDTTYSVTAKQDGGGNIIYDCETGNTDCQEATCYAQTHFISLLLNEQLENLKVPSYPQFSAWKNGGSFDNESCKLTHGIKPRDEMCCGTWKHNTKRLLRYGKHLSRACCERNDGTFKTYDSNLATCCDDGSVRVHGTC